MQLGEAVRRREHHRRAPGTLRCQVCHERHPCAGWRRARAVVLVLIRAAFTAARAQEARP
ncbi:hypothetical protein GCM10017581_068640 [Dactylosporangium matsuzakiense]|uniref:Uncharacterized protein n=1 Tax=Dactylosporangium matsuzakiense TaxID=53360 RepID=A0A9W6KN70_9ACTN|nr:hypothetical protein GCM10017581_068640 [Dactylosporangium matsuzakiense]